MILFEYMVWCLYPDDTPKLEGYMFFSNTPKPGEGLILSSGKLRQVVWVNEDKMNIWVKKPSGNY